MDVDDQSVVVGGLGNGIVVCGRAEWGFGHGMSLDDSALKVRDDS